VSSDAGCRRPAASRQRTAHRPRSAMSCAVVQLAIKVTKQDAVPPSSWTKIYAAGLSCAADDAHLPSLHGFAAAARAAPAWHRRTDRRTRHRFNTLTAYAVRVIIV